jgi:hypothetical protein
MDIAKLPLDLIYLISGYLSPNAILNFTATCRRYLRIQNKLLNLVSNKNFIFLIKEIDNYDYKIDIYGSITNLYRFQQLVIACMRDNMWYITWKDLNPNLSQSIKKWLEYFLNTYPQLFNKFKEKEYVSETILYVLWKLRKIHGQIFPFLINQDKSSYLTRFILNNRFSFKLTRCILLKLTNYKYTTIMELFARNYYNRKVVKLEDKNKNENHFKLIFRVKPYLPDLYYSRLRYLSLSKKQWTTIFIHEHITRKKVNYFKSIIKLYDYFPNHNINWKIIRKKFGEQALPYNIYRTYTK